jgi:hypothetical protein
MSVKLLAASVLLVQSGALLVSVTANIKLAQGLQTLDKLVFGRRYAGCGTCNCPAMLSQPKTAIH